MDLQIVLPAGYLNAAGTKILLEASGNIKSVEDLEATLTKTDGVDGFVRLKGLLTVRRGYVDARPFAGVWRYARSTVLRRSLSWLALVACVCEKSTKIAVWY